jgi:hypothetical protein
VKSPCPLSGDVPVISSEADAVIALTRPAAAFPVSIRPTKGRVPAARTERPPAPEKQASIASITVLAFSAFSFSYRRATGYPVESIYLASASQGAR